MESLFICARKLSLIVSGSRGVKDRERGYELFPYSEESPKRARRQDFLVGFDMVLEYKPGRTNQIKLPTH